MESGGEAPHAKRHCARGHGCPPSAGQAEPPAPPSTTTLPASSQDTPHAPAPEAPADTGSLFGTSLTDADVDRLISLRRLVGGTLQYHSAANGLKGGPQNLRALSAWPEFMIRDFAQQHGGGLRMHRMRSLLEAGLIVHSDFSGKCSPEAALELLEEGMLQNHMPLPESWLVLWSACDSSRTCQKVISNLPRRPIHLFDSMLGKLPKNHQAAIERMRPQKDDDQQTRANAYTRMLPYLESHAADLYIGHKQSANCCFHPGRSCPLRWADPAGISEHERPLTLGVAGPPCRPFSTLGTRSTDSHTDMEAIALWRAEMAFADFDIVIAENAEQTNKRYFMDHMPEKYLHKFAIFGSPDLGWPARRCRFWCVSINQQSLVWIGPTEKDVTRHFLRYFGATVELDGDVFCGLDNPSVHAQAVMTMARHRGVYLSSETEALQQDWTRYLPYGQMTVHAACRAMAERGSKVGLSGALTADLSQSVDRLRCGPWLCTLARSTLMCSVSRNHLFSPDELDFSMGWPTILNVHNECYARRLGLITTFRGVTAAERRSLAGNGHALPQFMSWFLYISSHCVRRCYVEQLRPPLRWSSNSADDDDDDSLD